MSGCFAVCWAGYRVANTKRRLDGKTFAADQVVIALGVTITGEKRVLGLVQTATENRRVCATFLRQLIDRGFHAPTGLLVVLDGAKGLRAAVRDVFGDVFGELGTSFKTTNLIELPIHIAAA